MNPIKIFALLSFLCVMALTACEEEVNNIEEPENSDTLSFEEALERVDGCAEAPQILSFNQAKNYIQNYISSSDLIIDDLDSLYKSYPIASTIPPCYNAIVIELYNETGYEMEGVRLYYGMESADGDRDSDRYGIIALIDDQNGFQGGLESKDRGKDHHDERYVAFKLDRNDIDPCPPYCDQELTD